jgi:hypothetical protein
VKPLLAFCCSLIAVVAASGAVAGPFNQSPPVVQGPAPQPQPGAGPVPQRDTRAPSDTDRNRMSADERHQLRRDIQNAGKDIYRPAQAGRGDGRRSGQR